MKIEQKGTLSVEDLQKLEQARKELEQTSAVSYKVGTLQKLKQPQTALQDKFHLPLLNFESESEYPPISSGERIHLTDELHRNICNRHCCGIDGLGWACCFINPDSPEHVLGPVDKKWIKQFGTSNTMEEDEGKEFARKRLAVHYEPFFRSQNYPMLRLQIYGGLYVCRNFDLKTRGCMLSCKQRPEICRNYLCEYLRANYFVRLPEHPHIYVKVR